MAEKNARGFVLGDDKEIVVENTAKKEAQDLQFHRLGHRVTMISIIIPILIAFIGYFIYTDFQKKVTKVYDTGSTEVQTLSKDMDSKFSSLSVQVSKLEQELSEQTKTFDQSLASIKKNMDTISTKLKTTDANLNDLKKTTSGLAGKIAPIETSMGALRTEISTTEEKLTAAVSEMATEIGKSKGELVNLNSKLSALDSSKIDESRLTKEINSLNDTMDRNFFSMNKKLNSLESKMTRTPTPSATGRRTSAVTEKKEKPSEEVQMIRNKPAIPPDEDADMLEQDIQE